MSDTKEWRGPEDGLPPVGIGCEYTKPENRPGRKRIWYWCRVVAHDSGGVVVVTEKGHYHLRKMPEYTFRPLRSEKERQIDILQDVLINESGNHEEAGGFCSDYDLARAVYAAGFRLTEPPE